MSSPPRVLHFVTGGFSGATQVALDLVRAGQASGRSEPLLVLRRKRQTDPRRIEALREQGVPVETVPGWSHLATIAALLRLLRRWRPDVLVAHGFPEHLLGRWAGLAAGVPHLVQVEHNSRERYSPWRLAQARFLAQRSDRIVGCSEGVRQSLLALGMPPSKTVAISNGIRLEPFAEAE
ncbi:MAG TPA: glycosyltransferase, partial [Roseateles sp.]|nr:glycosyltransferase [Roseateles sp.]